MINAIDLRNEIINDSQNRGYKNGSEWKSNSVITHLLNEPYVNGYMPISGKDLIIWASQGGRYQKIVNGSTSGQNNAVRSRCLALLEFMRHPEMMFDFRDSSYNNIVDGLVSSNIITNADRASLRSAATRSVGRAYELWQQDVTLRDVRGARHAA